MRLNLLAILLKSLLAYYLVLDDPASAEGSAERPGELGRNSHLSSPQECARTCKENEPPKICYYHFSVEHYTTMGKACAMCTPNNTNSIHGNCQCVTTDGYERTVVTVNRQVPGPSIEMCKGDTAIIDVENKLSGSETSFHWHGLWQEGFQYYDGVPFVTQCPITSGSTFRYQWVAKNSGTHYWHSHSGLQKMDGVHGSLIVRENPRDEPHNGLYHHDSSNTVIMVSDWAHALADSQAPGKLKNDPGQNPDTVLINGKGRYTNPKDKTTTNTPVEVFTVKSGYTYRFRMINAFSSVCGCDLRIQKHSMGIIATDGEPVEYRQVNTIISFSGERYDFLINANQTPGRYWMQFRAIGECEEKEIQQFAFLQYEGAPEKPSPKPPSYKLGLPQGVVLNPLDGICNILRKNAICVSQLTSLRPIDKSIFESKPIKLSMPFNFHRYDKEKLFQPRTYQNFMVVQSGDMIAGTVDGINYVHPQSPMLTQMNDIPPEQICNSSNKPKNCGEPCSCTNVVKVPMHSDVSIDLIDIGSTENLLHPFHIHGYAFHVISMGRSPDKNITKMSLEHLHDLEKRGFLKMNSDAPPLKDTVTVPNNGWVRIRFRASNPGFWLIHCHFLHHFHIGMGLVLQVGNSTDLPPCPKNFPRCGSFLPEIKTAYDNHDENKSC